MAATKGIKKIIGDFLYFNKVVVELDDSTFGFMDRKGQIKKEKGLKEEIEMARERIKDLDNGAKFDQEIKDLKSIYKNAKYCSEGLTAVQLQDGLWAFVDENGELLKGRYKDVLSGFCLGYAQVVLESGHIVDVDYRGDIYTDQKTWLELLDRNIYFYKKIPFFKFVDSDFMRTIDDAIMLKFKDILKDGAISRGSDVLTRVFKNILMLSSKKEEAKRQWGMFLTDSPKEEAEK